MTSATPGGPAPERVVVRGGALERFAALRFRHASARTVDVWVPATGVAPDTPLLVVQDGQNLFQPEHAFGGRVWGLDAALEALLGEEDAPRVPLVVAPWNTARRMQEYAPQLPFRSRREARRRFRERFGAAPAGDGYLRMLFEELLPFVRRRYGLDDAPAALMGSSMGGLIALYALCRHPEHVSAVASLSTSWTLEPSVLMPWFDRRLPRPGLARIYTDYGAEARHERYDWHQRRFDARMRALGYRPGMDWISARYPGEPHDEAAWARRLAIPLRFVLAGTAGEDARPDD